MTAHTSTTSSSSGTEYIAFSMCTVTDEKMIYTQVYMHRLVIQHYIALNSDLIIV